MNLNFTKEIPELAFLIEYSEKIEQAQHLLQKLRDVQQEAALKALEALHTFENNNDIWLGEDLIVEFQKKKYIVKGLNDIETEPLKVREIFHVIQFENKQTKGTEGEKEKS